MSVAAWFGWDWWWSKTDKDNEKRGRSVDDGAFDDSQRVERRLLSFLAAKGQAQIPVNVEPVNESMDITIRVSRTELYELIRISKET